MALCRESPASAVQEGKWINLSNNSGGLYGVNKITAVSWNETRIYLQLKEKYAAETAG